MTTRPGRRPDANAFLGQNANAIERMANDFASRWCRRSSKRSDAPRLTAKDALPGPARRPATLQPVYLIVGDDEGGKDEVVVAFRRAVPEDIRPSTSSVCRRWKPIPATVVRSRARCRCSAIGGWSSSRAPRSGFSGKRKAKTTAATASATTRRRDDAAAAADVLEAYVESPEPASTCLVLVAADINRTLRVVKALVKHAVLVECWGLKDEKELRGFAINEALERAGRFVVAAAKGPGMTIDRHALEPLLEHAGTDIATLRGDVERLVLYCHGQERRHAGGRRRRSSAARR